MNEQWIIVPNWDKFQHYGNRGPLWIKVYLELRDKPEWEALNYTERGLLVSIWMEYAQSKGQLECKRLGQKTCLTTRSAHLTSLNHAGWIQLSASKPRAHARAPSREVEVEVEKEKKENRASAPVENQNHGKGTNCPHCGTALPGPRKLAEHLYLIHQGPEPAHWIEAESKADLG